MSNTKKLMNNEGESRVETKRLMDFVDSLFSGYEESGVLADFKEELVSNLHDRIASMTLKGVPEDEAFKKATAELGDISTLADEISLKKKQEVIGEAFMDIRHYMKPARVAGYVAFGIIFVFGLICAAMAFLSTGLGHEYLPENVQLLFYNNRMDITSLLGVLFAFMPASIAGFTWLGLTQELPDLYPLSKKRAFWYAAAALLLSSGLILFLLVYTSTSGGKFAFMGALGTLLITLLPSIGIFAFMGLTEKDRRKPWAKLRWETEVKKQSEFWYDSASSSRFGMFSGAIWMAAVGIFFLMGFLISFKYSWIVFLFACAAQLVMQGAMIKGNRAN